MKKYRQDTILPSFQALTDARKQFYASTIYESHYPQLKFDTRDSRLTTLEARVSRKCFLLKGLPSWGFNKGNLDCNVGYWLQQSGLQMEDVVSITNHLVDHQNSILRTEFLTESKKHQFASHTRQVKCEWSINQKKYKMKTEQDIPTSDRLSKQPFFTLIDIFRDILPQGEVGPNGELQTDVNTLQVWPCKEATSAELLSQVCYIIDNRFFRRYVCVLFIQEQFQEVQNKWVEKFTQRMKESSKPFNEQPLAPPPPSGSTTPRASTSPTFSSQFHTFHIPSSSCLWATLSPSFFHFIQRYLFKERLESFQSRTLSSLTRTSTSMPMAKASPPEAKESPKTKLIRVHLPIRADPLQDGLIIQDGLALPSQTPKANGQIELLIRPSMVRKQHQLHHL